MPAPPLRTRLGSGCQATPSRGAKSSFCGRHRGVLGGASVMVSRVFTCVTVNGRVPLGDEGAALYSHRNPYVIVNVRVAFQLSCANRLQLEKTSCTPAVLETTRALGTILTRTFDKELKPYCSW